MKAKSSSWRSQNAPRRVVRAPAPPRPLAGTACSALQRTARVSQPGARVLKRQWPRARESADRKEDVPRSSDKHTSTSAAEDDMTGCNVAIGFPAQPLSVHHAAWKPKINADTVACQRRASRGRDLKHSGTRQCVHDRCRQDVGSASHHAARPRARQGATSDENWYQNAASSAAAVHARAGYAADA